MGDDRIRELIERLEGSDAEGAWIEFLELHAVTIQRVMEADCTFSSTVTSQAIKDNLLALAQAGSVLREVGFVIRKGDGIGAVRTRGAGGADGPHTHMCWSTGLGLCPFTFVGTDIDDATSRREFRFAGGGNNALRLVDTDGSANTFTVYEAICYNDDPVTVVVEPAP